MRDNLRWLRVRAVWILVIPFLWVATPTPRLLLIGGTIALLGLGIRNWAAGCLHKEKELATGGPYSYTRNPLYLGSLLLGVGVTVAGGSWVFFALFLTFFVLVYGRTIRVEGSLLGGLFGDDYRDYAKGVPLLIPRLTPYRRSGESRRSFTLMRWRHNREYEALLGALAGFAVLAFKMVWP